MGTTLTERRTRPETTRPGARHRYVSVSPAGARVQGERRSGRDESGHVLVPGTGTCPLGTGARSRSRLDGLDAGDVPRMGELDQAPLSAPVANVLADVA